MAIRVAKKEDLKDILAIYGPYVENTAISFEYTVPSLETFTERFLRITKQFPFFVWEEEGKILGYAYADAPFERAAFSWCAEPSVYILKEARGKGIGKALYKALEETLKKQGYVVLYAIITTENEDSIAFHEALGYRHLADFPRCGFKFDYWYGVTWMEKKLQTVEMPTKMPVPFAEIVNSYQN